MNISEVAKISKISENDIKKIHSRLTKDIKEGRAITAGEKLNGGDFILFSKTADGRKNFFKIAGNYQGVYQGEEITF